MKNKKIVVVLVSLIVIAGIYYFSNSKGSLNLRHTSFALESTEDVTKIVLSVKNETLILEKKFDQWRVNDKYRASNRSVANLIVALNRIDVLTPVSKNEKEQIASVLKNDGVVVNLFKNKRSLKKYYVSRPEMNIQKTYMMMNKSGEPFMVHVPSFKGLVASLFIVDENYWRDKTVFDYLPQNIQKIEVKYPDNLSKSFRVINYNDGTFALQSLVDGSFVEDFNVDQVARYFTYFQHIVFDGLERNLNQSVKDSILQSNPFSVIIVEDIQGEINKIALYRKPASHKLDEFGQKMKFDYDRAYARLNENTDLILIQYYIFDPLFKEIDYFR